jgi:hypothetical protein
MMRLFLLLAGFWLVAEPARAHRLSVDWHVADGQLVIVARTEDTPAAGADVGIVSADGTVVAKGTLDGEGRLATAVPGVGGVTVTVNAGLGHRRSLTLSAEQLQAAPGTGAAAPAADPGAASARQPSGAAPGGSGEVVFALPVRVGTGLAVVFAVAAMWMSYRNSRRLAALERRLEGDAR